MRRYLFIALCTICLLMSGCVKSEDDKLEGIYSAITISISAESIEILAISGGKERGLEDNIKFSRLERDTSGVNLEEKIGTEGIIVLWYDIAGNILDTNSFIGEQTMTEDECEWVAENSIVTVEELREILDGVEK